MLYYAVLYYHIQYYSLLYYTNYTILYYTILRSALAAAWPRPAAAQPRRCRGVWEAAARAPRVAIPLTRVWFLVEVPCGTIRTVEGATTMNGMMCSNC